MNVLVIVMCGCLAAALPSSPAPDAVPAAETALPAGPASEEPVMPMELSPAETAALDRVAELSFTRSVDYPNAACGQPSSPSPSQSPAPATALEKEKSSKATAPQPLSAPEGAAPVLSQMAISGSAAQRLAAIEGVGPAASPEHIAMVLASLTDPDPAVTESARQTVRQFEPERVANALLDLMCQNWPQSAGAYGGVVYELRAQLANPFMAVLDAPDTEPVRRYAAVYGLGCMRCQEAGPRLAFCTASTDPVLAVNATRALAAAGGAETTACLARLLAHPQPEVAYAALDGLANTGSLEAIEAMGALAADASETRRPMAHRAIGLLGKMPAEAATHALIQAMRRNLPLRPEIAAVLRTKTGVDRGEVPSEWVKWFDEQRLGVGSGPPLVPVAESPAPSMAETEIPPGNQVLATIPQVPEGWPPPWLDPANDPQPEGQANAGQNMP